MSELRPVIGLEVHCRLKTASKLFSPCPLRPGAEANCATDPYTWGMPGTLPTVNAAAVALAVKLALALGCDVAEESGWDRKHYFYPDLPKGYQITQHTRPLATGGALEVPDPAVGPWATRAVALQRLHLEEDAGKVHAGALLDYNRAGAPLVEIVTAPVIRSAAEAARVLRALRSVLVRLDVSDATMEDGSLRCDVNVSLQRRGDPAPGVRCEIKNLNSFNFIERAVTAEVERQEALLAAGVPVVPVTLRYDPTRAAVQVMRVKETELEYRWLPEPDLPPLRVDPAAAAALRADLPDMPERTRMRYCVLGLTPAEAALLVEEPALGDWFDAALTSLGPRGPALARRLCSWITVELLARVPAAALQTTKVAPAALAELVRMVEAAEVSAPAAKQILALLVEEGGVPGGIAAREGLLLEDDDAALTAAIVGVLRGHPRQVAQYRAGKAALWGFLIGRVMQALRGRADPQRVHKLLVVALQSPPPGDEAT
ncbi:Asp-tRNA(Asn)/Glu-tRNA(Gln) amidotransferase subunit GatB [Nannocystis radixulma]|uniref:Aspartyl/glutamyl-tRNA(Asn/Gln) amidotransferase subunit B n=1 Tax=Nannocystis radixulma TaxID=2995305 RepID=A0ABT5BKL2_9BACT|nr:Asp-tRNA(Asn)/Glu-tRNA(Gln) amidotransferase subunit GatB [Nannocystis radixulma]MDC0674681.1 Asp-tRNA(Asn)/Glu-tRNA(Gln) amidotransferase subunit GatB [Nannocystis radixulma]